MNFEGLVEVITSKEVNTKYGAKPVWSMKLKTNDGDVWLDYGFSKPSAEKGQYIAQDAEKNAYGRWVVKKGSTPSIKATPAAVAGGTPMKAATSYAPRVEFPVPDTDKGMSICRQNALTNAVIYLNAQYSKGKVSVNDVLVTAAEFARWTTGHLEVEMAEAIASGGVFPGLEEDPE